MKILTKYILKQLITCFILVLLGLTTLVWLTQSLRMIDMIVTKGVPVRIFLEMTLLILPNFIQILSPLALFSVVLFVFSRMKSDKEIMVMQAIGISNRQILYPVLTLAILLTTIGYFLTLLMIPQSYEKLSELRWKIRNDLSHLLLQEGQFNTFNNGLTLYIRERLGDGSINGIMAYDTKDPKNISVLIAEKGFIFQENTGFQLVFQKGTRQEFNSSTKQFSILKFDKYTMRFNDKKNISKSRSFEAGEYSLFYLLSVKPNEISNDILYRKYKVEALKRLTKPLYNITFVFLAMYGIMAPFYNRRGQMGRINFVILATLLIQSLGLAFENLTARNLIFMPLLFINIFLPIFLIYLGMIKGYKINFKKIFPVAKIILATILCLEATTSLAQIKINPQIHIEKDKPVDFEADEIVYDKKNDTITAIGNIIIQQNGTIIKTEKFIFNRKTNQIIIPQEVEVATPDGTTTHSKDAILTTDLKESIGNTIIMRLYEGSLVKASQLKRTENGESIYLKKVTYSPCSFCEGETPLWQLSAHNVKHNTPQKEMIFQHSFLELKEVPIFYFPYINIPDFTVKRKTGFLAPSFSHGNEMKQGINLPFFLNLSDNQNLILKPTFSTNHDPLGVFDYESRFTHGVLQLQGSGTRDNDGSNQGHIKANMRYDISNDWRLSGQYYRTSSDTYFRRYSLPDVNTSDQFLSSNLTMERFGTKNYFNFTGLSYQSLLGNIDKKSVPVFIPTADYQFFSAPLTDFGLYAFSHLNTVAYDNRQHFKSNRLSMTQGLKLPYVSSMGASLEMRGSIRADGYNIDTGKNPFSNLQPNESYSTNRFYPVASTKVSYPLAKAGNQITQVLEPIAMFVTSPTSGNKNKIPNIDSIDAEFDDTNLFSENRFVGYDRVETGTRANYGIQYAIYGNDNKSTSLLFGQSYHFSKDEILNEILGSKSDYSNYVGRWQANYNIFSLNYRFNLDQNTLEPVKNEITLMGGTAPLTLGVDYMHLKENKYKQNYSYYDSYYGNREEILFFGSSQFSKDWSLSSYYRYNLAKDFGQKGLIETGTTAQYDNDCTAIAFEFKKSFTHDRDYNGNTSFMVKFILKTLGSM